MILKETNKDLIKRLNKSEQKEVHNNVLLRNVEIHPQAKRDSRQEEAFETREIVDGVFKELKIKDKMGGFYECKRKISNRTKKPPAIELRFFTQLGVDLLFDSLGRRSKILKLSVVRAIPHYLAKFSDKAEKCAYDYRNAYGGRTKIKVIEDELVVMGKKMSAKDLTTLELFLTMHKNHRSLKNQWHRIQLIQRNIFHIAKNMVLQQLTQKCLKTI